MKRNVILAVLSGVALTAASGLAFASTEDNLNLAIYEAQAGVGGTVLSVTQRGPDAVHKYDAVLMDPNGILQHVTFDLPVDHLWPGRAVSVADYPRGSDTSLTRITMAEAVKDAEDMTGKTAVAVSFVASDRGAVVAYKVALASLSGGQSSVLIDGRSGDQIADTAEPSLMQ